MAKMLDIRIAVPEIASGASLRLARQKAHEAAILTLQQEGCLTIREAASELSLSYEAYLSLLAEKGLPASQSEADTAVLDRLRG